MEHARRMRIAGAAISVVHLACGLLGWLAFGVPGALLLFGLCAAITLGLALVTAPLLQRPPTDDGGSGGSRRDPGDPPEPRGGRRLSASSAPTRRASARALDIRPGRHIPSRKGRLAIPFSGGSDGDRAARCASGRRVTSTSAASTWSIGS